MALTKPCIIIEGKDRPKLKVGKKWIRAARVILERKLGRRIQYGMLACHSCNNKKCIEEEHIYEGTYTDNLNDAWSKGRRSAFSHRYETV